MSRSKDAWKAYENNDLNSAIETHEKSRIAIEPWHDIGRGEHIKDIIYAASDGLASSQNPKKGRMLGVNCKFIKVMFEKFFEYIF